MEHDIPKLLQLMIEMLPRQTQSALADRLSHGELEVSQPQVSRWMKGQRPDLPNYQRIIAVAGELGVLSDVRSEDVASALAEPPRVPMVKVRGYVGASGEAVYYRLADDELEEVPAPDGASDRTVACEVRGKSLGPVLESWLVFYDDIRSPVSPDMLGSLCVVGLADDRLLVKRLERKNGDLVLVSNNGDPDITDAVVEWAAKVTSMRPR
ncbi:MAG: putative phage repressor [Massilia sp.]|nr:putative phage repressor [Massilia sp.]